MESMVEHCSRHPWDTAPRQGETHYQWGLRVDAIYDTHEAGMAEWISKPLEAAPKTGEWKRAEAPPNSNVPMGNDGRHKPQERDEDEDHHEGGSEYQGGRKGAYEWGPSSLAMGGGPLDGATPSRTTSSGAATRGRQESPKEPKEDRGARGKPSQATRGAPTGGSAKGQGRLPQGDQQRGKGSQHWQARADQTDQPAPACQRDRKAP